MVHGAGGISEKGERHTIFAEWISAELLPPAQGCGVGATGGRVLDVAGGKGHLSAALVEVGLRAALIDPCAGAGRSQHIFSETVPHPPSRAGAAMEQGKAAAAAAAAATAAPTAAANAEQSLLVLPLTLEQALASSPALAAGCAAIVGLHPDEATDGIVDEALKLRLPFAVMPCCVFPKLFPHRRLANGGGVGKFAAYVQYLLEKDPRMRSARLPFAGCNRVLFMSLADYERPRRAAPKAPDCGPCSAAAKAGDLGRLRALRAEGKPWNAEVGQAAAWAGQLEVLQWALDNGCPWDWEVVLGAAESCRDEGKRAQVTEWARKWQVQSA